jgi:hypothetical protein
MNYFAAVQPPSECLVGIVPPVDGQEYTRGDTHELEEVRLLTSICGSWDVFLFLWGQMDMITCRHLPLSRTSNDEALPLEPTLWIQRLVINELLLVAGLLSTCRALLFSERRKAPAHIKFTHPDKEVKSERDLRIWRDLKPLCVYRF